VAEIVGHRGRIAVSRSGASLNSVVWSTTALAQVRSIRAYIEQFNPRAAHELANGLYEAGNSLAHFPRRGRIVSGTDSRELVTAYPYTAADELRLPLGGGFDDFREGAARLGRLPFTQSFVHEAGIWHGLNNLSI